MVRWALGFFSGVALLAACSKSNGSSGTPDASDASDANHPMTSSGGTSGASGSGGTSSGGTSGGVADGPPRVEYIGRVDWTDSAAPRIGWAGTKVVVRFEGTALSIEIDDEETSDGGSHYDVNVDGKSTTLALVDGAKTYEIAKGLPAGTHVVTLTRRTEPQVGVSQFKTFTFPNGGKLLPPPGATSRHIEFVGDSEIAGYGIECKSPDDSFSAATENELRTYPELVAASLHAESHNLAYSGKGVFRNGTTDGDLYPTYYPEAVPYSDAVPWDFSSWQPDVVWVALGANDYDPGPNGDRPAPAAKSFTDAFRALLDVIRAKNPNAKIVLVVQAFVNDDYPAGYNARTNIRKALQTLMSERKAKGDANVLFAELPQATEAELTGCDSHPSVALHAKLAPIVAAKIAEITGWK